MREILFKAKRLDNGEWVKGYFCGGTCDSPFRTEIRKCAMIIEKKTLWWLEVDPETVCQYTGLNDKNGVKIFEGDILRQKTTERFKEYSDFEWELYGIVRYGEYDWNESEAGHCSIGYFIEPTESISINPSDYLAGPIQAGLNQQAINSACYPFEVIGNIHDKEAGNGT